MAAARGALRRLGSRVAAYVADHEVLLPGEHLLLMLSGGADSMALLALLPGIDRRLGLGLTWSALHVDYRARGADSDRDRAIVERSCAAAGVPLDVLRLSAPLTGGGFQARARELRYRRAREVAAERGCDVIVTAHNRDDQAETILYRLAKYATPRGLAGMRPRDGMLARPLLCAGAAEIRAGCVADGVEFGVDVTNESPRYARNALRLEVMPALARLNPRLAETLADAAAMAAAEADVLAAASAAARARVAAPGEDGDLAAFSVPALASEPPALRALVVHDAVRDALDGALAERRLVEALLRLAARPDDAGVVSLGRGLEAVRARGLLRLRPVPAPHHCAPAGVDGAALAAAGERGLALAFCGRGHLLRLVAGARLDRRAARAGAACVGLAAPPRRVTLRHPRRGERFVPLGLGAETTVLRFLAAARVAAERRARAVVLDVDGAPAWVGFTAGRGAPQGRVAQACRVDDSTQYTLLVTWEGT